MKGIYIICSLMFLAGEVTAQYEGPVLTLKSLNLKGKVRSVETTTYMLSKQSDGTLKESKILVNKMTFDKNGYIDSSLSGNNVKDLALKLDYHYYWNKDTLCSTIHKRNSFSKTIFDSKQQPIYSYFFYSESSYPETEFWYKYDSQGKLIETRNPKSAMPFTYKKNNDNTYTVNWGEKLNKSYYIVNQKLQKILTVYFSKDLNQRSETINKYDTNGNVLIEKRKDYKKDKNEWIIQSTSKTENSYQYDNLNNWNIKKIFYDGNPHQIERRTIEYW